MHDNDLNSPNLLFIARIPPSFRRIRVPEESGVMEENTEEKPNNAMSKERKYHISIRRPAHLRRQT